MYRNTNFRVEKQIPQSAFQDLQCLKMAQKSRIQHCERSELRLQFEWTKVHLKCQKWSILPSFSKSVLPDWSILI